MSLAGQKEGARTPLVHSCLCPEGQSVSALLGDAGRSVFPWQECNLLHIHTHTHTRMQCPLSSSTANERDAVSLLRHPRLPSRECRAPAPSTVYPWPGWGLGSHSCSPGLWPLVKALSPRELLKPSPHSNSLSCHLSACILASAFWCLFL